MDRLWIFIHTLQHSKIVKTNIVFEMLLSCDGIELNIILRQIMPSDA